MNIVEGYEPLAEVFQAALDQSQSGKGKERHANDRPFLGQPISEIGRMVGVGYNVGQAMKKGQESMRLPYARAQAELLGAINYLAAAYLLVGEKMEDEKPTTVSEVAPAPVPPDLDLSLPTIIVEGDAEACKAKFKEEFSEWGREVFGTKEYLVEAWDTIQAALTWESRSTQECLEAAKGEVEGMRGVIRNHFKEGNPVMEAKAAMLTKNAKRGYYDAPTCSRILATGGREWRVEPTK